MKGVGTGKGTTLSERESRLLDELRKLQDALEESEGAPSGAEGDEELLAIATFCRGLEFERWRDLAESHQLEGWIALKCRDAEYPALRRLLGRLRELAHQTEHDPLTGLLNRRGFERLLAIEMERSQRFSTVVSLAVLDVDDFKKANDRYGHPAGDEILVTLADLLKQRTRKINIAARIGGEEFAVILPGSGHVQAQAMLLRLQRHFSQHDFKADGREAFRMTFSAGVAGYAGRVQMTAADLVKKADAALYRAKKTGKNRTVCAIPRRSPADKVRVEAEEKAMLYSIAKRTEDGESDS